MSQFLINEQEAQILHQRSVLQNINSIMQSELNAKLHGNENFRFYQTSIKVFKKQIVCYWRFEEVSSSKDIKLIIRPVLSENLESNLKIQTQRGYVDLLWVMNKFNKQKNNKGFTFLISQYKFIELTTIIQGSKVIDINQLTRLLKITFRILPKKMQNFIAQINPYLERNNLHKPDETAHNTVNLFLNRSFKMLNHSRYKQIQQEGKLKHDQIQHKMLSQRKEALSDMKNCLSLMGYNTSSLSKEPKDFHSTFEQWERNRNIPSKKTNDLKNVFGVKILKETKLNVENDSGRHCTIVRSKLKLVLMMSVNKEVNDAFQNMTKNGKPIIYEVQKEMEVVKKIVRDPNKIQSIKSLQNQLQFIKYIKEKGSENISTYYLKQDKPTTNIQIIMDYYPRNLKEMLHQQGELLSFRQKLSLFRRIVKGVDWLASNYVCHRDLKPTNIMIDENRIPKIIDFGSCCAVFDKNSFLKVKQKKLLGTPDYFHPFIKKNMGCIYRQDQYEQHILFDAYSLGKVMKDIFIDGFPNILPNLQSLMQYMAQRCLEENPICRFTYSQMLFLLDNFIQYIDWL